MEYFPSSNRRRFIVWIAVSFLSAWVAWNLVQRYLEWRFPIVEYYMTAEQISAVWQLRAQFGSMFGAAALIFSTLTIAFAIYATYQQAHELDRQNEIKMWTTNYDYLREGKRMIADHKEILELHGLPSNICETLGVTPAQIAYVLIDAKAADLYYKMANKETVEPTEYRKHLLKQPVYRKIVKEIIVPGKMLGDSAFSRFIEKSVAD